MQSDNEYKSALDEATQVEGALLAGDDQQETTLNWLLDQDYADPSEKVFTVSVDEPAENELTEYEAEVANRPMFAGNTGADDFSALLGEEIVMTSATQGADIYSLSGEPITETAEASGPGPRANMAIDHTRDQRGASVPSNCQLNEGSDILGLCDEDDIGERFLLLQKARAKAALLPEDASPEVEISSEPAPAPAPTGFLSDPSTFAADPVNESLPLATSHGFEFDSAGAGELDLPAMTSAEFSVDEPESIELEIRDNGVELDIDLPSGEDQADLTLESAISPEEFLDAGDSCSEESFDVFDYVAANEPPSDEEDFDRYLLQGEHLEKGESEVEDLSVEKTRGIASVDPQLETTIDYHEDFTATDEFNSAPIAAITTVIAQLMEEISSAVSSRLVELSLDPQSVQVDLMLGTDAESIAQYRSENYVPVLELGGNTPAALSQLGQMEIDTIYVRLFAGETDGSWNGLFADNFAPPGSFDIDDFDDLIPAMQDEEALVDDALSMEFDEAVFGSDHGDDLGDGFGEEFGELFGEELGEGFGGDLDEQFAELSITDPVENLQPVEAQLTVDPLEAETESISAVFEEDIFGTDLAEDFIEMEGVSGIDVEAMIDSLADSETDIGEICGVALDEFSTDESHEADAAVETSAAAEERLDAVEAQPESAQDDMSWCIPTDIKFSYTSKSVSEVYTDFLDAFLEEGASELEKLEDAMGEWEKDIASESVYASIPRILHTLKGIAKSVGLQRYGTLIHNFETLLEAFARPQPGQESAYFRVVNAWLDASVRGLENIQSSRADIDSELPSQGKSPVLDQAPVTAEVAVSEQPTPVEQAPQLKEPGLSTKEERKQDKKLAEEGAKVLAAQQTIRMSPETVDRLLSLTNEAQQLGVRSSQSTVKSKRAAAELLTRLSLVRAHVSKIADKAFLNITAKGGKASSKMDALEMDQYSELQEAADILREGVEDLDDLIRVSSRQNTVAEALLKQQASVISSLGSSIRATRVVPVSRLMPGLRRIVRNVSADLGKAASFRVLNEVGTLDRDNYARCQIILEHMIRNALDHGIENPQDRVAAGKDATGRITIDARKKGSDYIVSLSDDGKGIDPDFMRDIAHEKGLDIDVDALSDDEAIRLIFHKGFSTANALSEISGRGVGMDIVLSELQHIGGDIEIVSTVGVGTTFKVRIPSNVTVNGALLVAAGEVSYAIPLDGLIAVEHVPVAEFYDAIEKGAKLPLFGMDCEPAYLATICRGDSLPERASWGATIPVIIAGDEQRFMAIAIDDVTQALELVIRSLGAQFTTIPGLAGGATTADGQSIVALDLNALVASVATDDLSAVSLHTEAEERMLVLVVDDSRTQRMVATSQFDTLGVETVTAENGLVAIDLLNTTHRLPDVILLDIEMPVKDGIQTLREIRKSSRYSDVPVIMVTSRTGAKHRSLAQAAGCNGYMGKPFNFPKLVEQIDGLTEHKFQLT